MTAEYVLIALGIIVVLLITQRWFWMALLIFGALGSLFAMIASVIHFQIFGAIGFFVLMIICWACLVRLPETNYKGSYADNENF